MPRALKNGVEHWFGELAGIGVLTAGVKRSDQDDRVAPGRRPKLVLRAMCEGEARRPWSRVTDLNQPIGGGVKADFAEPDGDPNVPQQHELRQQVSGAALELLASRLIKRRSAAQRCRDEGVDGFEAVAAIPRIRRGRESAAMHRTRQPRTGRVAGKYAAGAVASVRRRRKADDKQPRFGRTKAWYGLSPIALAAKFVLTCCSDGRAVGPQLRATPAVDSALSNQG